ncbi:hypothetical protein NGC47_20910 [Serratia marcescens]|uniref:hypothetical protein n=1 Tax=Serratia TaxID=613 RepID=UPI002DBD649C|nr:hypothetical protein [Serratia marcescens]MEB7512840.1 hypothetical protein [Serratia marcescens]
MEDLSSKQKETRKLQQALLAALLDMSPQHYQATELPPQHNWMSTRQLANAVNVGVYRARHLLLNMLDRKEVIVTDGPIGKSLRWYPTALLVVNKDDT